MTQREYYRDQIENNWEEFLANACRKPKYYIPTACLFVLLLGVTGAVYALPGVIAVASIVYLSSVLNVFILAFPRLQMQAFKIEYHLKTFLRNLFCC